MALKGQDIPRRAISYLVLGFAFTSCRIDYLEFLPTYSKAMAHYDIYREELGRNFHAFGHALWEPSPGVLGDPVAIGDVGFIRQGKFHRIFNVLLPEDHQTHKNFGTPEYHEPLQLKMEIHVDEDELSPNDFYSAEVKVISGGFKVLSSQ